MSEIKFDISINYEQNRELIETVVERLIDPNDIADYVVDKIDMYEMATTVAENTDWNDISDALYENIRDNNLQDLADSLASSVSDFLMEGEDFYDAFESSLEKAVAKYYDEGILNEKLEQLNKRIVDLENKIADMNKKKFWKKMMKGK